VITILRGRMSCSPAQVKVCPLVINAAGEANVSPEFKILYSDLDEEFRAMMSRGGAGPGRPYFWEDHRSQLVVFPIRVDAAGRTNLADVETGLRHVADRYMQWGIHTLAMPTFGIEAGSLSWQTFGSMLEEHLGASVRSLEVFVYECDENAEFTRGDFNALNPSLTAPTTLI
jgi:hypothetical protein